MVVNLLPGTDAPTALNALSWVKNELSSVGSGDVATVHNAYLRWANDAADHLGRSFDPAEVDRLVLTPRHWALQAMVPGPYSALMSLVQLEVREATHRLEGALTALSERFEQWRRTPGVLVVPDTNVYLHHRMEFDDVDWAGVAQAQNHVQVNVVLPMLVIDELDRHKRTNQRTRARSALRRINALVPDSGISATLAPGHGSAGPTVIHLLLDDPRHVRLPHPDSELVDRAQALAGLTGRPVTLITFDTAMAVRARAAKLQVCHLDLADEKAP
ncbi:PIN domain-containing protein [Phycicoccus sp. M110.8]|uniref:PIN domain-containing protein n=1 Tax=Phycicoccus sp. M110.8 TaxID=3075433 RepID=UPI0028FD19E2|nr:PIN domain-containing protein [Phycicoccus sp. M110.8]MDU0314080.1 PIN domain-containing protein [Phycicoccus sp. M110.8]